jgi:hypothetical protein
LWTRSRTWKNRSRLPSKRVAHGDFAGTVSGGDDPCAEKEKAAAPAASVPCFDSGIRRIDIVRLGHLDLPGQPIIFFHSLCQLGTYLLNTLF